MRCERVIANEVERVSKYNHSPSHYAGPKQTVKGRGKKWGRKEKNKRTTADHLCRVAWSAQRGPAWGTEKHRPVSGPCCQAAVTGCQLQLKMIFRKTGWEVQQAAFSFIRQREKNAVTIARLVMIYMLPSTNRSLPKLLVSLSRSLCCSGSLLGVCFVGFPLPSCELDTCKLYGGCRFFHMTYNTNCSV